MATKKEEKEVMEKYGINSRSTKQEIIDALMAAHNLINESGGIVQTPEKLAQEAEAKEAVAMASADIYNNVFSEMYNDKFKNLKFAISAQETRLQELYGLEKELASMAVVVQASNELKQRMKGEEQEIRDNIAKAMEDYKKKSDELAEQYDEELRKKEIERNHEEEAYEYQISIQKRDMADEANAYIAGLEKRRNELQEAVAELDKRVDEVDEMRKKIEAFPAELENEFQRGVTEGKEAAEKANHFTSAMAKKDAEHEKAMLEAEIASLKAAVAQKDARIESMETKLDSAYNQINDLAKKTAETSGSIKVIGGNESKK